MTEHKTDVVVIGAGPVGLFAIFQAGMLGMKSHVIDNLPHIGGQCSALYPEKPIYDIPAFPEVSGQTLIDNLEKQAAPFNPTYHLSQQVIAVDKHDKYFLVTTSQGTKIRAKAIIIAAGAGAFGPNRPPLNNILQYENHSIFYSVRHIKDFENKKIVIAGGGDSAVDWALALHPIAKSLTIVHRRDKFRASPDNVNKLRQLAQDKKIDWRVPSQLHALEGIDHRLSHVIIKDDNDTLYNIESDILLPFYGLSAKLGPIAEWGLNLDKTHIQINQATSETNIEGIYAIGDIATYPHKLKLILTGFAEAASALHHAYKRVFEGKSLHFEYSTSKGVHSANT